MADDKSVRIKFRGEFDDLVDDASDASRQVRRMFNDALTEGLSSKVIKKYSNELYDAQKKYYDKEKRSRSLQTAYVLNVEGNIHKAKLKNLEEIKKLQEKIDRISLEREGDLNKLDKNKQKYYDEALREEKELLKLAEQRHDVLEKDADTIKEEMLSTAQGMRNVSKSLNEAQRRLDFVSKRSDTIRKTVRSLTEEGIQGFGEKFGDKLSSAIESATGKIDLSSISKNIGSVLSKGAGLGLDKLFGPMGAGATMAVGAITGMVGVMGTLVGALFEVDRKIKDFNKSAISSVGAYGVMQVGTGSLSKDLSVLNHSLNDLTANLGISAEDGMSFFSALDQGGITMARMVGNFDDVNKKQQALSANLVRFSTVARVSGVGLNEYATSLTDYVDSLGQSLDTVNDSFSQMAEMASESAFGTRRFYSMVVQATSGQAALNVHLADTGDLLLRMSKILGQKKAAEFLGANAEGLSNMGWQERLKTTLTTGRGRTRGIITADASRQARTFASDVSQGRGGHPAALGTVRAAAAASGVANIGDLISKAGGAASDPRATQALIAALSKLTDQQYAAFTAELTSRDNGQNGIAGVARGLTSLIHISRGTNGHLGDMAGAFDDLSAGAALQERISSARAIGPLNMPAYKIHGAANTAAFENVTGFTGQQRTMVQNLSRVAAGMADQARRGAAGGMSEAEQARRYGAVSRGNQIYQASVGAGGNVEVAAEAIHDSDDLITSVMDRNNVKLEDIGTKQEVTAFDTFNETVNVADILENKVYQALRDIHDDLLPVGRAVAKWMGLGADDTATAALNTRMALGTSIGTEMSGVSAATRARAVAQNKLGSETDLGKRKELQDQIKNLDAQITASNARIETMRAASSRLASGDTTGLTQTTHATVGVPLSELETDANGRVNRGQTLAHDVATTRTLSPQEYIKNLGALQAQQTETITTAVTGTSTAVDNSTTTVATAVDAVGTAIGVTSEKQGDATRDQSMQIARTNREHLTRMLTRETKLGDALAKSGLPDAIVEAQVRQQLTSAAFAAGLNPKQVGEALDQYQKQGTLSADFTKALSAAGAGNAGSPFASSLAALGYNPTNFASASGAHRIIRSATNEPDVDEAVEDFIYRGNGVNGTITPIDTQDQFVGFKPNGPVDRAAGGGGGNVSIQIYGGDENRVYNVVKRVLQESGISPGRGR